MGNPAIDYFSPTLTGPNSLIDEFWTTPEVQTGAGIFEFTRPEYSTSGTKYALWRFVVNDAPLSAVLTFEAGRWFAESDWLNLFGEGDSPSDAIRDLSDHIEHFIDFYGEKESDEFTEYAKETRDRFLRIIRNP